jgi:hypothetical protein
MREQGKLLNEQWLPLAGILRLSFPHHVNHLDAAEDHSGSGH